MTLSLDSVKSSIRAAFDGVTLGDGVGLWQGQAIDDYEGEDAEASARARDIKHDWSAIPSQDLRRCESSLSFFDADGMRFHIPAFMIAELDDHLDVGCLYTLTSVYDDYSLGQLSGLSDGQRAAIVDFLRFMVQEDEDALSDAAKIQRAIDEYWTR